MTRARRSTKRRSASVRSQPWRNRLYAVRR
jgi:hypothetical protein